MPSREEITANFVNKNKQSEVLQMKARAKDKLNNLDDKEKAALVHLDKAIKASDLKTVGYLLNLFHMAETK